MFKGIASSLLGANTGGIAAGLLERLRQRKSGMSGPRGRLKNLETRVKNLEGNNSENPRHNWCSWRIASWSCSK